MRNYTFLLALACTAHLLCMEKEKTEASETSPELVRPEVEELDSQHDASTSQSSWLDYLTISKIGKPGSLAIFGAGAAALIGTAVYGAKRGWSAVRARLFASKLRHEASDAPWSIHCMNFLADASLQIGAISDLWEQHGSTIQQDPHHLLMHDEVIAVFTPEQKAEFLVILHEYTNAIFTAQLQKILDASQQDLLAHANPQIDILKKYADRFPQHQKDQLMQLYAQIDALRDSQDLYCAKNDLKNPYKKVNETDWVGRMQKLIDAVHEKFPGEKIPYEAKNIFFLTSYVDFMEKLDDEQKQECSVIFDVWINQFAQENIERITAAKQALISIAQELFLSEPETWQSHPNWSSFEQKQQEELRVIYRRVKAYQSQKERLFVKL